MIFDKKSSPLKMSHVFYGISYYTGSTKFTFNTGLEISFVPQTYFTIKNFFLTPNTFVENSGWIPYIIKKIIRSLIIELTKKLREIL